MSLKNRESRMANRTFDPRRYYIVNWSGTKPIVYRGSYNSRFEAELHKGRKERSTGATLHVSRGTDLNEHYHGSAPLWDD